MECVLIGICTMSTIVVLALVGSEIWYWFDRKYFDNPKDDIKWPRE